MALSTVYRARQITFFQVNRVEHQKLNQTTPHSAVWLSFWCSTRPLADTALIIIYATHCKQWSAPSPQSDRSAPLTSVHGVDYNQCPCLPKAELNTKTNPNGHHPVAVWVRFGVQLDYSCRLKSVSSAALDRVRKSARF